MKIITMATPSYAGWLYHFLSSVNSEVVVYRVNFPEKMQIEFEKTFPKVIFRDHQTQLIPHEKWNPLNKVFKVTYLKGLFMKKAFEEFQDKILWCDCTELILGDLKDFEDSFGENGFRIKRNGKQAHKKTFAAIFGMCSDKIVNEYYNLCENNKTEWFSDQLALSQLALSEIEQGDWISFNYAPSAKSWSDRGKTGSGKATKEDYLFTERKYIDKLEDFHYTYEKDFNEFMNKIVRPSIMIHTDDISWCYATSTKKIAELLKDDFEFTQISLAGNQRQEIISSSPDLVWARCSSIRHRKFLAFRPDLKSKSFTSITIGGEMLDDRTNRNINKLTEAGLIVQNDEGKFLAEYYMKRKGINKPIFILPNGCDIEKFKPVKKDKFIVGWNGRAASQEEIIIKGYKYFKQATELAECQTIELKADNRIPFDELPKFYNQISILILPSHSEGCSNTINEALASGVPVLATKVGWHGENCEEFDDGIIFIERNLRDITEKLKYLKDNPQYMKKLSINARKFAERYSWDKVAVHYKETFNKMIEYIKTQPQEEIKINIKPKFESIPGEHIIVKGLRKINLGQLKKNGATLWFEVGTTRQVPYFGKAKQVIDSNIKDRSLEQVFN